ncbi:uncharacterized protein LOC107177287 [Citrus sinensis]|uniref:uncharacterized protein LOC107177287 n=1 Tax=Citrus sinensis TaxID=2711 RepID=UPI0007638BD0|nr:uncharacterized protein LOC107177287 [Citrus sinensis]
MGEGNMFEEEVEDEEEIVVMDEVGISITTPIMQKEKAQVEDEAEAIQDRECRAPNTKIDERVNYVEEKNGEDDILLLARNDTSGGQENTWYLDTGASNHMSGNKSMFVELNESMNDNVAFGDDSKVPVKGKSTQNKWRIHQLNVKSAFLNEVLEEKVYIEQLLGYEVKWHKDKVLKLKKALYELKQTPIAWNNRIDTYFQENSYTKCSYEYVLYVKDGDILIVCLYVVDLIFTGNNLSLFREFNKVIAKEFDMTDIGLMAYYLGIDVKQQEDDIFIY